MHPDLTTCRAAIDACDDQILQLLKTRYRHVLEVAKIKEQTVLSGHSFMRPGREGAIISRLLTNNQGDIPPALLITLWRELMMSSLQQEQAFTVAAVSSLLPLARDHFGASTPLLSLDTPAAALRAVTDKRAMLAVLPTPENDTAATPWWPQLQYEEMNIVFRLPLISGAHSAIVAGRVTPEASGNDTSFVLLTVPSTLSRDGLKSSVTLPILHIWRWYDHPADSTQLMLVEIDGIPETLEPMAAYTPKLVGIAAKPYLSSV